MPNANIANILIFTGRQSAFSRVSANIRTVNCCPPGVQMTRLTKLGHAAIFGRNYCNGDFLALALTTIEF